MIKAPRPENEHERLAVLEELDLFNTDTPIFDRSVDIVRRMFNVPIALVALTTDEEQRFKAVYGLPMRSIPRDIAICSHALIPPYTTLIIPDTTKDERSNMSPMVTSPIGARFYAGIPLVLDNEFAVGTMCIMDTEPHSFSAENKKLFEDFGAALSDMLQGQLEHKRLIRKQSEFVRLGLEHQTILETTAVGKIRIDDKGHIEAFNPAAERLFGYNADEVIRKNVSILMPEPWRSQHDSYLVKYLTTRDPKVIGIGREVMGLKKNGDTFPFHLSVSELQHGEQRQFIGFVTDLTEQKAAEATIERERATLRAVLDSTPNLISAVDQEGRFILVNKAYTEELGTTEEQLLGRTYEEALPNTLVQFNREMCAAVTAQRKTLRKRFQIPTHSGLRTYMINKALLLDSSGKEMGFVTATENITEQEKLNHDLRQLQEIHRRGEEFAQQGAWSLELATGDMTISEGFAKLVGFPSGTRHITQAMLRAKSNPDAYDAIDAELARAVAERTSFQFEYSLLNGSEGEVFLRARGDVIRDESGKPIQVVGVTQNVTKEVLDKRTIEQQQHLLTGVNQAVQAFLRQVQSEDVWGMMLQQLLSVTEAQFGFLGEVIHGVEPYPCLKIHAITNLSWSADSDKLFERAMAGDMMFCNPDNLIGAVMKSREPVVVPKIANDPRSGGFPPGHPQLENYLGIPLYQGNELVGVVAIANRDKGVSNELAETLQPFLSSYAIMIISLRQRAERLKYEQQLIESKEQADRASQSKSQFLSSMSHELRTPLNAILGFAQLMKASRREPLSPKQQEFVEHILKAGDHLMTLVNEVLNLAKIEAGEVTLSSEPIDLSDMVREACDMLADSARAQNVALINECDSPMTVHADLTRTRQVLLNLISNAIKYNHAGGQVRITELTLTAEDHRDGHQAGIAIRDTGIGIPKEKQHKLFRAFERLGQESSSIEGTGIGLVITKQLVELMNGSLTFESIEGEGTTFILHLPASTETPPASSSGKDSTQVNKRVDGKKFKVLYVEDNLTNRTLMEEVIAEYPHIQLIEAIDGEQSLELALTEQPDLILMDINLPGISGQQAAVKLKSWPETAQIPIVALSADATAPTRLASEQLGLFNRYLTKPLNLSEIERLFRDMSES